MVGLLCLSLWVTGRGVRLQNMMLLVAEYVYYFGCVVFYGHNDVLLVFGG